MKVLYIIDSLMGYGAEKSLVQIAIRFENVRPVFIQLYRGDEMKDHLEKKDIKVYSLNLATNTSFIEVRDMVLPIVKKENPTIIHSTLFRADMVTRGIKKHFPNVLFVGSFVSNSYGKNRYRQLSFISKLKLLSTQLRDFRTVSKVDYFISNSKTIKNSNMRALNVSDRKVKVIYRGRNIKGVNFDTADLDNLKRQLNLPEDHSVFLNIGRLTKGKGQIDLLYAFRKILCHSPKMILLIAGEGSLRIKLENLILELNLKDNVKLLGYREDVLQLLALADYFIFPSYYEGLPGSVIEAVLAKKPAIVSDIPEVKECFPQNGALFFEAGNVESIYACMTEAIGRNDWSQKVLTSYNYAIERFDIRLVSKEYEAFYTDILKERNKKN